MANTDPEAEESSEDGSGGEGRAPLGPSGSAARLAPLGPEQLRRVLEQVTKAQPSAEPPPQPFVLQDAARRLRDAAQQAALHALSHLANILPSPQNSLRQLEAICVKVTSGETPGQERPMPPPAAFQPRTVWPSPPLRRNHSQVGLSVTGPPLLRVQPLLRTGPQPCHLSSPPRPPVEMLVQRPLPTLSPVSVKRAAAPKAPSGQTVLSAPPPASDPPPLTSISPSSANVFISSLHTKHAEKLKKPIEVKTRSGRISRPPKYKAKDYRFIKTEDLADGHLSDSDDYSELSVGEDEDQRGKRVPFESYSCSLRPKAFKCQTCEKSYIGKGGLARHFRLNPGHGQVEPAVLLSAKANGYLSRGCMEDRSISPASPESSAPTVLSEEGVLSHCATEADRGGQEFVSQWDRERLVAGALPQLTPVVTVCDFLLMKVERTHLAKPLFPAVYKEFEELHEMVKKMCQDYLRSSGPCSLELLEINNSQVAESLGITEELLKRRGTYAGCPPGSRISPGADRAESGGQKRGSKITEEVLTSVKRTRRETVPKDAMGPLAAPAGGQERSRTECAPAARAGCGLQVSGRSSYHCGEGHPVAGPVSGHSMLLAGQQLRVFADVQGVSVGPSLLPSDASGPAHPQLARAAPELSGQRAGGSPYGVDLCCPLVSGGRLGSQLPAGAGNAGVRNPGSMYTSHSDGWQASPGTVTLMNVTMPSPETALFPEAAQVAHASRTAAQPGPQLGLDRLQSATSDHGSHVGDLGQFSCGAAQTELENIVAVGETMAFEITSGCHDLFAQGQDQIFIQASDGFMLSHPGPVGTREGDILVSKAEGPPLQVDLPPAGVPLEAVEAFLTSGTNPPP
ncbi:zinc finger protein 839 [Orycteropus afer afer]|uniref:Zinc finger protein 839 n=1 Tax=Orycteropus afer afer TaxID=1230840 RepID=A0AC54ZA07_ORYAF|nr:zinc finger protein 839 [Orycteropus afer afer]